MIIIDSSVWIDYLNGLDLPQTRKVDEILGVEEIITIDLITMEVLQGFRIKKEFEATRELLDSLVFYDYPGKSVAVQAARNYVYLRSLGYTIRKTVDTFIATTCIMGGFQLLHNDRDFTPFEKFLGLKSVNY